METNSVDEFRKEREADILRGGTGGGETLSTITEYASAMGYPSREDFVQEIRGKRILDLGSGLGGLAKDAFV